MSKLEVKIGKLVLKNPVMVASGTFGYAKEFEGFLDLNKLGAIITKTITLNPRNGNPMPRVCETSSGMLNAIGLQNDGLDSFMKEKIPYFKKINSPIIMSIYGEKEGEFEKLVKVINKLKIIQAIELNLSCPNLKRKGLIAQDKDEVYTLIKKLRTLTDKTLIAKLSPNVTDIVEIAQYASKAGVDALSLVNTFSAMAIDIRSRKPIIANITGGLSGPCIKPIALKMVYDVSRNIDKPVIGIGGIMNANDALEFMIAGATAIQTGTANFIDPGISEKIVKDIDDYLKQNKIKNINELIGSMKI